MCVGRATEIQEKLVERWFTGCEAKIIKMSAKKHDQLMSIIQVLLHFHTIVLGNTFQKLKIPIRETLSVASPIYKLEMDMIGRIFSQDPFLYGAIEMLNPETKKVTNALLKETAKLTKIVQSKNLKEFEKTFKKTSQFLGEFKDEAMSEIDKLLNHLN